MPDPYTGGERALRDIKQSAMVMGMADSAITDAVNGVDKGDLSYNIANTIFEATGYTSKNLPGKTIVSFVLEVDGDTTAFKYIDPKSDPNYLDAVASSCPQQ